MDKIKSALELAMERAGEYQPDREQIERDRCFRIGREIGAMLLQKNEKWREKLSGADGNGGRWIKEGVLETLALNVNLPEVKEDIPQISDVETALASFLDDKKKAGEAKKVFLSLKENMNRYCEQLDYIDETLRTQYEPQLRRKEQLLAQQTGQRVRLTFESDPDFLKILRENVDALQSQFGEAVEQVRALIRQF